MIRKTTARLKTVWVILFTACLLPAVGEAFESELWPGEGIPEFRANKDLNLFREPSTASPLIGHLKIKRGDPIIYQETLYKTITPGRIRITAPIRIHGRSFGDIQHLSKDEYYSTRPDRVFYLQKDDRIEFLQKRAEGECLFRVKKHVIETELTPAMQVESEPVTEWWVLVQKNNKTQGWLLIDDNSVTFLNRRF